VHGGIPTPDLDGGYVEAINKVPYPLKNPEEDSPLAWDIMWSDPVRYLHFPVSFYIGQ